MSKSLTKQWLIMAITIMMTLSSLAVLSGNASAQVTAVEAGNYTLSYDPVTSTIYNIKIQLFMSIPPVARYIIPISGSGAFFCCRRNSEMNRYAALKPV